METTLLEVTVRGVLKPDGTVELSERPSLAAGPVQVILRPIPPRPAPPGSQAGGAGVEEQFQQLATAWRAEKIFTSSLTDLERSPHYRGIIALGWPVVPLLLRELERDPDYWFEALHAITGEDPVPSEDRGDLLRMTGHWLAWARHKGPQR
jgi:hypothetical protein